ncbi:MAG: hypothetical protein Q8P15_00360 [Nanoarchaeota archaeon]|nr:hypothetical protein [Nanoarchaeota archaeon]
MVEDNNKTSHVKSFGKALVFGFLARTLVGNPGDNLEDLTTTNLTTSLLLGTTALPFIDRIFGKNFKEAYSESPAKTAGLFLGLTLATYSKSFGYN